MQEQVQTLIDSGRLPADLGEKVLALAPGVYCYHKSWGPGVVKEWDLFGDKMLIDFDGRPGHGMKLQFAAKSLEVLGDEHVLARYVAEPDALRQQALDDPIGFARAVLGSYGGSMLLDDWEDVVKGRIVPEGKYRSWWEAAKKVIRTDRSFVLPPKRNVPFEMRASDQSPAEALLADFEGVKDAKSKTKVVEAIVKDLGVFTEPAIELEGLAQAAAASAVSAMKRQPSAAMELLLARQELLDAVEGLSAGETSIIDTIKENRDKLPEIVKGMGVGRQRQLYALLPEAFGEGWVDEMIGCLEAAGARAIGEVTKFLNEAGKGEQLAQHLASGLGQRSLGAELLAWICKERRGLAADAFGEPGVSAAIMGALERDHLDESTPRSNRLHDLLMDDKELIADLLEGSERGDVRHFTRRIQASPVFEGLNKNSLLARIVKAFPAVEDLITGEKTGGQEAAAEKPAGVVVSWESYRQRQEKLEDIVTKKIPENSKEIQVAREYGDLRENFEFKAAKQQQAVLMRQQAELEAELATARPTDFANADTSTVSIGTVVDFEDLGSGAGETVTVLGAWDTDTDRHIISYLSELGTALLNKKVGDELELPTEVEGVQRTIRITAIRAFNDGSAA